MTIGDDDRLQMRQALDRSKSLCHNANKFRMHPYLLLFTIEECDEKVIAKQRGNDFCLFGLGQNANKSDLEQLADSGQTAPLTPKPQQPGFGVKIDDPEGSDKFKQVGSVDDEQRKTVMTNCYFKLREMMIENPTNKHGFETNSEFQTQR